MRKQKAEPSQNDLRECLASLEGLLPHLPHFAGTTANEVHQLIRKIKLLLDPEPISEIIAKANKLVGELMPAIARQRQRIEERENEIRLKHERDQAANAERIRAREERRIERLRLYGG